MGISVELRQLRFFLCVVDHRSVAAAARVLNIAQPALSRQISTMEAEMGARLFNLLSRGVSLTRFGRELEVRARVLVAQADQMRSEVAQAFAGTIGRLRIGVIPGYGWLPGITGAVSGLASNQREVRFEFVSCLSGEQIEMIKCGRLDAGCLAWRSPQDPSLRGIVIHSEKMAIAIPRKSSLASSRNPRLRDFAGQTFLTFPRDRSPAHYDSLMRKFAQAGIEPAESAATASDSATLLGLVAAGLGFAIVPETFARYHQNEIVLRKIPELDMPFELQLVWSADNRDPLLLELVRAFEHPLPPDGH